jgi:hypothetical protein
MEAYAGMQHTPPTDNAQCGVMSQLLSEYLFADVFFHPDAYSEEHYVH